VAATLIVAALSLSLAPPAAGESRGVDGGAGGPVAVSQRSVEKQVDARAGNWRKRYAVQFIAHFNDKDWKWLRRQPGGTKSDRAYTFQSFQDARKGGRLRGGPRHCFPHDGPSSGWCDVTNGDWYGLLFTKTPQGIRVDQLLLQD